MQKSIHGGIIGRVQGNYSASAQNNYYLQGQTNYSGIGTAKTEDEIKTLASTLGSAYKDDTYGINNGYPVLTWQAGGLLEKQNIMANAYYDKTEEKVFVDVVYSKNGIDKVTTANDTKLVEVANNKYELENLDDITTTYIVVDKQGNEKVLKINDIYIIPDAQTLSTFRDKVNAGDDFARITVIQTANIDMSSVCSETVGSWIPIGATGTYFDGTYNGNYHTISNLYINTNQYSYLGMFSIINPNSIIKNIIMENVYIYNSMIGSTYTGTVAGWNYGTIKNCGVNSGTIELYETTKPSDYRYNYVAGICGVNVGPNHTSKSGTGITENCYNKATIKANVNTSTKYSHVLIGGITGNNTSGGKLRNCYNVGKVIATGYYIRIGGIAGYQWHTNSSIEKCYNIGEVTIESGTTKYIGGIAGLNGISSGNPRGTISNSYCTTDTSYAYYYYSSGFKTSIAERKSAEELKTYANIGEDGTRLLGDAYVEDTNNINNGFPILAWQEKISK